MEMWRKGVMEVIDGWRCTWRKGVMEVMGGGVEMGCDSGDE